MGLVYETIEVLIAEGVSFTECINFPISTIQTEISFLQTMDGYNVENLEAFANIFSHFLSLPELSAWIAKVFMANKVIRETFIPRIVYLLHGKILEYSTEIRPLNKLCIPTDPPARVRPPPDRFMYAHT